MDSNDDQILIFTNYREKKVKKATRDGSRSPIKKTKEVFEAVTVDTLKNNIHLFLANLDTVITESPKDIGGLALDTVEIHAQIDGKGKIGITGIFGGEFGAQGGIKFVLKKKT
jgi:hypothetical protein